MAILKIVSMVAIATAVTLTLTYKTFGTYQKQPLSGITSSDDLPTMQDLKMAKRVSRFLVADHEHPKNLRGAADHCNKDNDICYDILEGGGKNTTCCNNKCVDIATDKNHCGACQKSKCKKYTDSCCGGKCVDLAYDKGNCGSCGFKCKHGKYCIYGFCDYA